MNQRNSKKKMLFHSSLNENVENEEKKSKIDDSLICDVCSSTSLP